MTIFFLFFTGENAKKNRSAMVGIIHRYYPGDKSLLEEIEANAKSDHPLAQMARETLPVDGAGELEERKRKRELELVCVALKKGSDAVIAVVGSSCAQIKEEVAVVENSCAQIKEEEVTVVENSCAQIKEEVGKVSGEVVLFKEELVKANDNMATVIDHSKEVSMLTKLAKIAEQKAKHSDHISFKVHCEAGAAAAKKIKLVRKKLAASEKKNEVLLRQNADLVKRIQKLEAGQEELKAGQAELKAGQDMILAFIESMQSNSNTNKGA